MRSNIKIISVGGSIVNPPGGFDREFLRAFRSMIRAEVKKGNKFVLVIGGGSTSRVYQKALADACGKITNTDLDLMGIAATKINAEFIRLFFRDLAHKEILVDPTKKVKTSQPVIVASGWKPGSSSDKSAVLFAKTYGAKEVLNLSNISYVYDKDPNKYNDAKKIEHIDWKKFRKEIVGNKWIPGNNVPFDPTASKIAQTLKLRVSILNGTDLVEVKKAIQGKSFKGTVVGE